VLIEKEFIDFLYQALGEDANHVLEIPPGVIVLDAERNGELFDHPHVRLWHEFLLKRLEVNKEWGLILPCTSIKPYRISATHRLAEARLAKYGLTDAVQVYVMSEPMVLVPRELDLYYPFANYNYPPNRLGSRGKKIFIELLHSALLRIVKFHRALVAVLPKHHMEIFMAAARGIDADIHFLRYGRLAFKCVSRAIDLLAELERNNAETGTVVYDDCGGL